MTDKAPDDASPSAWAQLGPVEQAREWEDFRPGTFEQIFKFVQHEADYKRALAERAARHERFLDYVAVAIQLIALTCGLAAVGILAWTARYYADHNAAGQGVKVFGLGAASIVAAFLGINAAPIRGRLPSRWSKKKKKIKNSL